MIFNIYFEKTNKVIPFNNQHQMNGVISGILGHDNPYHDTFSNYSISSIQGGIANVDKTGIVFNDKPYIQVASEDVEFVNQFTLGVLNAITNKIVNFFGLCITNFEITDFIMKNEYDVVKTISPILIKNDDGRKINCKDDGWLDYVTEHCRKKLSYLGIVDDTFKIVLRNPENVRTKMIYVGDVFNPCTTAVMSVYGTKKARKAIYNLGIGNSTGSGFGAVKIIG